MWVFLTAGVAFGLFVIRKVREHQWGFYKGQERMDGKIVIITGANSGIGKKTARELVARGATVILACRNKGAAHDAVKDIQKSTERASGTHGEMIVMELDLSSLSSIRRFAKHFLAKFTKIDILLNNAGVYVPPNIGEKTQDGFEIHYGVNHLGHFLLTNLLLDRMKETQNSRIVIVSSGLYKQGAINFSQETTATGDLVKRKGRNPLYNDSKLANVYHARELSKRLKGTNVSVFVPCPGFTYTNLSRWVITKANWLKKICFLPVALFFVRSSTQGAQSPIMCCVDPTLNGVPFGFFRDCRETKLEPVALDDAVAIRLWEQSEEQCKGKKTE